MSQYDGASPRRAVVLATPRSKVGRIVRPANGPVKRREPE